MAEETVTADDEKLVKFGTTKLMFQSFATQMKRSMSGLPAEGLSLSEYTWADLSKLSSDAATNPTNYTYLLGQTKSIELTGFDTYEFQLIGVGHDDLADGTGKAGFTFQSVKLVGTHNMNSSNVTTGGWASTAMRTYLTDTILPALPSDVQGVVKEVSKKYCASYSDYATVSTCTDKLFFPSHMEVFGETTYGEEGAQYQYWSENNNASARIKYNGTSAYHWWLRSVGGSTFFRIVNSNGSAANASASNSYDVSPCFCI